MPLPTSLTQAKNLLETKAHVNINRYRKARSDPNREEGVGAYADLVFPNAWAMIRSTRGKGDYADLGSVKEEWLNPLLREFGYRRRRR